jgi:hypothetical protein
MQRIIFMPLILLGILAVPHPGPARPEPEKVAHATGVSSQAAGALCRAESDIVSRDLYYGPGGRLHAPAGTFAFVSEDLDGTSPKLIVKDAGGTKWTLKLGPEAKPETAASRLVWGAGYFANEDYFLSEARIDHLPPHLHRGHAGPDGLVTNVRMKRHNEGERKVGHWAWSENAFANTREFNGLRVLMALLNNWDLTDENNAVYQTKDAGRTFMVSDVGSTFGTGQLSWPMKHCRGDLNAYRKSRFIVNVRDATVDFYAPAGADWFFLATPHEYRAKAHLRWIGRDIPRDDARWLGGVMGQLSPNQIRDAFRAAGYSTAEVEGFATVVQQRIQALKQL